ncbi:Spy0128 family protein [Collinsella aerofaciens]|uniref:Spy0128 family protein n=1 Tax=Collinsella aerofaciens TaxID=74426 RepID=UPI00232D896C|nr:FctA domain-containing protein [Collinsella aerofaciens]MDB1818798.1 FctA domain-containing protein [Collinsella aerofaciens]MDB1822368.1 FctA domain-containing protein [Collinsella aerofaciens]MDB1824369.1 FctA domain-containing protein [Collinsella aerofaciens]MDB1826366.1 FctA domain-containing protein [Collinsella aerofaciens]MDC0806486.1 FctA domain-containing protein [Collinsella aerofaciens]
MKANSDKSKQSNKATRRVLAGVLCGASVLSLVLSLVMPPISQAIANDAQTVSTEETVMGGGSSSESTDVGNTNNGDTENQNSDDAAGDDEIQQEEQPKDESQAEENEAIDDGAGSSAEEAVASEETATDIKNAGDLQGKLLGVEENQTASFTLAADIDFPGEITLNKGGSNITLDLSGHKIKHSSADKPLFNVAGGASLTIRDSAQVGETVSEGQQLADQGQSLNADNYDKNAANYGKNAELTYDNDNIPSNLTYYVTESSPSGTGTTETLVKHDVEIKGAIVACGGNANLKLINLYNNNGKGGTFNLVSGVITQKQGGSVSSLVYAENGSTVNMRGGYVCGASGSGAGGGIEIHGNSTLEVSGGVIAGNSAPSGGGVYAKDSTVNITNGVISGNSTLATGVGFGGGIMAEGGSVTVSGGYITNNKYANYCGNDGNGDHGGAGLAAKNGTHVTISGGQITGNYSEEAGGGVYVTDIEHQGASSRKTMAWLNITGGTIASNVSFRSEGAGIRVGQMVDAMIKGTSNSNPVYITNNHCMSRFDWGGGGIFVQGDSKVASNAGRLFVYNSYISSNEAGGYGGGVAVCPTGKTLVTGTDGTAIFGNTSAGNEQNANDYESVSNTGNNGTPHLSGGGHGKDQDSDAYNAEVFRENGHADFFLAAEGHTTPIAAVIGKMLGGGDAKYRGSLELQKAITIPANGGVQVYKSIGLSSDVKAQDPEAINARKAALEAGATFITGNHSWNHGGGIMSNGDLYMGAPEDTYVYPSLKLKATKKLEGRKLNDGEFSFTVYRKDSDDPLAGTTAGTTFNRDVCTEVGTAANDAEGSITFDLGEQFASSGAGNEITYYLVEDPGGDSGITYDSSVYKIVVTAEDTKTLLMSVPSKENSSQLKDLYIHNYTIKNVGVTKYEFRESSGKWENVKARSKVQKSGDYYPIICEGDSTTFTNKFTPYDSKGSWTPMATKVVEGGEMKEFTLQLATDTDFTDIVSSKSTTADGDKSQTLSFDKIDYKLDQLDQLASGPAGRGASKTFTYYVREKDDGSLFSHYTYDKSVYQITVNATDDSNHHIDVTATYKQIQDRDGKPVTNDTGRELTESSTPTFTNTYSTSLPLSGMSGVTLTYLAGAVVLCAAAAWMHIRRKANAKGGKRRE